MPVDIRNFFGTAKKKKDEKKVKSNQVGPDNKKKKKKRAPRKGLLDDVKFAESPNKRKEISASDFFASSPKKKLKPSPEEPKKEEEEKPHDTLDLVDTSEDEAPAAAPKPKPSYAKVKPKDPPTATSKVKAPPVSSKPKDPPPATEDKPKDAPASSSKPRSPKPKRESRESKSNQKSSPTPRKRAKKAPSQKKPTRDPPLEPQLKLESFDTDTAVPECLDGYTFVFTGVLGELDREYATDLVKTLGGRVTGAVSGKTDYLVVGEVLEDGRPYTEGSKYKRALKEKTHVVMGEEALFGLFQQYDDKARAAKGLPPPPKPFVDVELPTGAAAKIATSPSRAAPPVAAEAASLAKASANPYAKSVASNPYAKTSVAAANPYASKSSNPYAKKPAPTVEAVTDGKPPAALKDDGTMLWVDKYKPTSTGDILGNQDCVRKLTVWLAKWEDRFNTSAAIGKSFSNPNGPWKAALLSGPPGIGKTTTATLVAQEAGRDVMEFNASDVRSKKALKEDLGDIGGSHTLEFGRKANQKGKMPARKKRCIIMDEVDGMGAGDRSGMSELIQMIKNTRVPIICICNDRQSQKMKSLLPYCMDLRYKRPVKSVIASLAVTIAAKEGLKVERNAAEAIAESCGNDVRQVLNCLQMWASNSSTASTLSYKELKEREREINKDEILRVGLFDAARTILEGRKGLGNADLKTQRDHFLRRTDAFFVDYNFVGLLVQQNYLKVVQGQYTEAKRTGDQSSVLGVLDRMHDAAQSMSDFTYAENMLRGEQNWSLLPFTGMLTVKTGYHAGGENGGFLPGYPEFTTWLGRNSTKGKKVRIMNELQHHMNYKISGGTQQMRLSYLPVFKERLLSLLSDGSEAGREQAIRLMDEYGLNRDDVFEKLDEFNLDSKAGTFAKIDSKKKTAFTKAYNAGVHKSQALVAEQGGAGKKPKRAASSISVEETGDLDAIDDDKPKQEEQTKNDEDELDPEKIKAMFKKTKKRKPAAAKGKGKKKK